MKLQQPENE
ncbi:Protein of unknown function [Bacillus mycoides]|nr:Protein of unknown function [Bacillus mycoides]